MFGIGFTSGRATDPDRPNWSGDAVRPLAWSAWYPTDDARKPLEHAEAGAPPLFVSQGAVRDAAFSGRQSLYPVVLLSHGTGGTAASLAWLAEGLARQGFVVMGIDHHGNTASEPYRAEGFLCWWERARDLSVILDHHAAGPFARHLDLDRVLASGFSLGGYTAISLLGGVTQVPLFSECSRKLGWADGPREFPNLGAQVERLLESSPVFRASWERQSISFLDKRIKAAFVCAPAPTVRGVTVESLREITVPVCQAK
jgi:predicted dienelactone hydrolase